MGEIEFVNDLCCNYLVISYEGGEGNFALRMMTQNTAEHFLPMELRRMDGETFLYYNISGMQNMEVLYGEKTMDRKAFQNFMWQLHGAIEESRELFLPGDGICLKPTALFLELGTGRWKYIYIPVRDTAQKEETQRERESLAEFLVMHMDYEDRELTETVYQFYEEICAGVNIPWEGLLFETETGGTEEQERNAIFSGAETVLTETEGTENRAETESITKTEGGEEKMEAEKSRGRMLLLILLCAAMAATFVSGRVMPEIVPYGAAACIFLAAILFVFGRMRKEPGGQEKYETKDMTTAEPEENFHKEAWEEVRYGEKEDPPGDRTIYMDIESRQEKKLYGIGKCRRQKILLERLPCLVGKDKTLTDHVIEDPSVSRMHARFSMEEKVIWMQDLNSTNGTYHNGMRLKPHEKVALEPEDEIGFGQTQFVFR